MKKRMKKLMLSRETLAQLDNLELRMAGGTNETERTCPQFCLYSNGRQTCDTCNLTCNTNEC